MGCRYLGRLQQHLALLLVFALLLYPLQLLEETQLSAHVGRLLVQILILREEAHHVTDIFKQLWSPLRATWRAHLHGVGAVLGHHRNLLQQRAQPELGGVGDHVHHVRRHLGDAQLPR